MGRATEVRRAAAINLALAQMPLSIEFTTPQGLAQFFGGKLSYFALRTNAENLCLTLSNLRKRQYPRTVTVFLVGFVSATALNRRLRRANRVFLFFAFQAALNLLDRLFQAILIFHQRHSQVSFARFAKARTRAHCYITFFQ